MTPTADRGKRRCRRQMVMLTVIAALATSACGGGGDATQDGAASLMPVKVPAVSLTSMLPVWVAQQEGYFRAHGVDLRLVSGAEDSPIGVPLVMSGKADIALNGPTGTLQAAQQGLPVRAVCGLTRIGTTEARDDGGIVVKASSKVDGLDDLTGKSVALTSLKSAPEWTIRAAIERAGGSAKNVKFVQSPLSALRGLVESGKVDAAAIPDPLLAAAVAGKKLRLVARHNHLVRGRSPSLLFFGKKEWVSEHQRAVQGFRAALQQADAFIDDPANDDKVDQILAKHTKIPASLLREVHLNEFDTTLTAEDFSDSLAFMRRYAGPQKHVDIKALLPPSRG